MLTQERLKELFHYNPETGDFTRIKSIRGGSKGAIAGCKSDKYYSSIGVDFKTYKSHKLIWLYVYGSFPENEIDHINGIRNDNRLVNLRDVTPLENCKNLRMNSSNSSGVMGVSWCKSRKKWEVQLNHNKKAVARSRHKEKWDAICARKSAELKYNFNHNHGNIKRMEVQP